MLKQQLNNQPSTNQDEVVRQIYKTYDYARFSDLKQNRKINQLNYSKLIQSMQEEQLLIPICVNENFDIIDGQHRAKACEALGLPIYYYQETGYGVSQMRRANLVSSTWNKDDFLNMYVSEENPNYILFQKISGNAGLSTNDLIKVIAKLEGKTLPQVYQCFVEGDLNINDALHEKMVDFLTKLQDFSFFRSYRKQKFVSSFLELYCYPQYNHNQMLERLQSEKRQQALKDFATRDEMLEALVNKVYSFGAGKRSIFYDINRKRLYIS